VGWVTFALALSDAPIAVAIVGLLAASVAGVAIPIVRRSTAAARRGVTVLDARVESVVRDAATPAIVIARDGTLLHASAGAATLLGYGAEALLRLPLRNLVTQADAMSILDLAEGAPGARSTIETSMRTGSADWLSVELIVTNLVADRAVGGLIVAIHDVSRWKSLQDELTQLAFHDTLTHLPNRALFINRLEHSLGRRRRHARGAAVLFIDLDDFKTVNDSLGHLEADALLALAGERLTAAIRPEDTAARLGGDEFAILLDDVDEDGAQVVARRLIADLAEPFPIANRPVRIGGSIGIAHSSAGLTRASDMLRAADLAMYQAKEAGKNQYRMFEPSLAHASTDRLALDMDLRGAIERGELVLHYQPIVDARDNRVASMEALLRWVHPQRGIVPPAEFIPIAEKNGLMIPIGEWVLREACRQARSWQDAMKGRPPVAVNVNLSGVQLQHPGLIAAVSMALEDAELSPDLLALEITESVIAHETEATTRRLHQLRGLGVHLAIDDFGTGFSALSYLRRFPIDIVKIDRSFIVDIDEDESARALVRGIIHLAHSLKLRAVAEGVETDAQQKRLVLARPMDARAATDFVLGSSLINLWVGHAGPELTIIKSVVTDFERLNPGIRVEVTGGVTDERIHEAMESDDPPTVVSSFESDSFATEASRNALLDLEPYMRRDGIDEAIFTTATAGYTRDDGGRWALPLLADTYGLVYNRKLLAAAGVRKAPRTIQELTELAKRLTVRNPDGSLRVVGFDPTIGFYENSLATLGHAFGVRWLDAEGTPAIDGDEAWVRFLTWQKELVDWYGQADLAAFHEELGEEFAPNNAFHEGRLAMCLDGEWRVAFIAVEAEELDYGTAPLPVDEARPELYGSGYINGSVIGMPGRARHPEAGWQLIRYLATDEAALAKLSNGLRNVPSTRESLHSPALVPDRRFAIFLDIFGHERSTTVPLGATGPAFQEVLGRFVEAWQAGEVPNLGAGLALVDRVIRDRLVTGGDSGDSAPGRAA
jgi:diguanylate cyclase (GGDEF)-like protein